MFADQILAAAVQLAVQPSLQLGTFGVIRLLARQQACRLPVTFEAGFSTALRYSDLGL